MNWYKEKGENTCGAHDEECTNWCDVCKIWECDQCYSVCRDMHNIVIKIPKKQE